MHPNRGSLIIEVKFKVTSMCPTLAKQGESHSQSSRSLLCMIKSRAITFPRQRSNWPSDNVISAPFIFLLSSSSANFNAYRRSAPTSCRNDKVAVKRKVARRSNNERVEMKGWTIVERGKVPVADKNRIMEKIREWEKIG